MIATHYNHPLLTEMSYHDPVLKVRLRGKMRTYLGVPKEVAYRLYYAGDPLSVYARDVKGRYVRG